MRQLRLSLLRIVSGIKMGFKDFQAFIGKKHNMLWNNYGNVTNIIQIKKMY